MNNVQRTIVGVLFLVLAIVGYFLTKRFAIRAGYKDPDGFAQWVVMMFGLLFLAVIMLLLKTGLY